jgi:hypothetical protein
LPPAAYLLEERALGLGERPVRRGDEQHQIRPRDEVRGNRFVLSDDGVGARCVDDVDLAEDLRGRRNHVKVRLSYAAVQRLAVLQHVDLRRRRRHPFLRHLRADERVDERALSGVEFSDDDEQEKLVELFDGSCRAPADVRELHRTGRAPFAAWPARAALREPAHPLRPRESWSTRS